MSGFWRFTNNYGSRVSTILDKDDISLEELLNERDTIPELLASNAKLTEYLRQPEVLKSLVDYVLEDDEYQRAEYKKELQKEEKAKEEKEGIELSNESDISGDQVNSDGEKEDGYQEKGNRYNDQEQKSDDDDDEDEDEDEEDEDDAETSSIGSQDSTNSIDNDLDEEVEETEAETHTRRAQVAAEILSVDVWSITDAFMESTHLLQKLWSILDKPAPLPILSATYFMKINEHLLDMKTPEMVHFILNEPNLVLRFVRHIETPPLMDFMLKVISTDKPDSSTGVIDVLKEQNLISSLVAFLSSDVPSSIQSASSDFLKAFITISANNAENTTIGPNELSRELVSEPTVRKLLNNMLQGGTGLSNGVGIVIEIIRKNNSDYDPVPVVYVSLESHPPSPKDPIYLGTLVRIFSEAIPQFTAMLEKEVDKTLETPFGAIEPLGFERFKICELVAELIHCSNMSLLNEKRGEEIIKERDEVREILIQKHKELINVMETASLDDEDIIREIEKMDLNRPDKSQHEEGDDEELPPQDEQSLRHSKIVGDLLKIGLFDNEIIVSILKMFFKFPWNNFLHNVVFDIVQQILNAQMDIGFNKFLAIDLFDRCHITKLIIDGHNNCLKYEEETGLRLGYMGHLTLIAEEVVKFTSLNIHHTTDKSYIIDEAIDDEEWKHYVDDTLVDIRNKYNSVLGSDGKQMNEHDMELFQKYYGSYDDEEEEEEEEEDDVNEVDVLNNNNEINREESDELNQEEEDEENLHRSEDPYPDSDEELPTSSYTNNNGKYDLNDEDDSNGDGINWESQSEVVDSVIGGHPYHEMTAGGLDDEMINNGEDFDDIDNDIIAIDDDDDDYEDPNDDGLSYTKANHPLYQSDGSLRSTSNENLGSK